MDGQIAKINVELKSAGLIAQRTVKQVISAGDFAPLSEATLRARANRKVGGGVGIRKGARAELESRAAGNLPSTEFAKPLVDTGQLRNAITFVVRGS